MFIISSLVDLGARAARVRSLLAEGRPVLVVGPHGCGKAAASQEALGLQARWISCAHLDDLDVFGVPVVAGGSVRTAEGRVWKEKVLLLDEADKLSPSHGAAVAALLVARRVDRAPTVLTAARLDDVPREVVGQCVVDVWEYAAEGA